MNHSNHTTATSSTEAAPAASSVVTPTSTVTLGSAIYLSEIDDYHSGFSQACINPIFTTPPSVASKVVVPKTTTTTTTTTASIISSSQTNSINQPSNNKSEIIIINSINDDDNMEATPVPVLQNNWNRISVRSRRRAATATATSTTVTNSCVAVEGTTSSLSSPIHSIHNNMKSSNDNNNTSSSRIDANTTTTSTNNKSTVVTATIADCLACSGCITTTETVLLQEQHSLYKLKQILLQNSHNNNNNSIINNNNTNNNTSTSTTPNKNVVAVATISSASIADLCRFLSYPSQEERQKQQLQLQRDNNPSNHHHETIQMFLIQFTHILHEYLNITAVLDSTITLQTTLQIAAHEFYHAYMNNNQSRQQQLEQCLSKEELYEQQLLPSIAISSHQTQYWIPITNNDTDTTITNTKTEIVNRNTCTTRLQQSIPIISSSCPAIICLIEKSYPKLVPNVSTIISPMMAAAYTLWLPFLRIHYQQQQQHEQHEHKNRLSVTTPMEITNTTTNENIGDGTIHNDNDYYNNTNNQSNESFQYYHFAIMPCHDKKLEASRNDFKSPILLDSNRTNGNKNRSVVDMVITTMELIQLLYDAIMVRKNTTNQDISSYIEMNDQSNQFNVNTNHIEEMYHVVRSTILSIPILNNKVNVIDCSKLVNNNNNNYHFQSIETWINKQLLLCNGMGQQHIMNDGPYLFTVAQNYNDISNAETITPTSESTSLSTRSTIPILITQQQQPSFVLGSGGYADYIFRYIAETIFHLHCPNDTSIWCPIIDDIDYTNIKTNKRINTSIIANGGSVSDQAIIVTTPQQPQQSIRMSARTARQRKQREYYEAIIYQNNNNTKQYCIASTKLPPTSIMIKDHTIVLRFVIAYGMTTVQNALTKLTKNLDYKSSSNNLGEYHEEQQLQPIRLDYIECMACTNSCLNGNGQIRSIIQRESPSDQRLRVQQTQLFYPIQQHIIYNEGKKNELDDNRSRMSNTDIIEGQSDTILPRYNDPLYYTRYHIVPPMQHTMGVAAGIAVQDTIW